MSMISGEQPRRSARQNSAALRGRSQQARATSRDRSSEEDRSSEDMTDLGLRDKQRLEKINEGLAKSGLFTNEIPPRFGGSIPSPRQSYEMPSRRPSAAGGDRMERERIAQLRSLLGQMGMPTPPIPGVSDMGSTVPGEGMNRPAPDINDAFFGPDRERFDVVEFLMGLMGRR